jgi:zona occludens toxin
MPITLITGLPGHGKTLYTLARFKGEAEKAGRTVFQCAGQPDPSKREGEKRSAGINGLKLPWPEIDPMRWWEAPPGSIVVIDEAQVVFPVRGRGEPPEWIQRLSTHRHLGIDIVLITQGPMLLDSFVRQLVDRHFHVVRKFGTHFATVHEYANGCRDQVLKSRGTDSIRHEWRYPKEVFEWYTSAEVHTVKRRVPMKVWVLLAAPLLALALGYVALKRLSPDAQAKRMAGPAGAASAPVVGSAPGVMGQPVTLEDYYRLHKPMVPDLPHTAPIYAEVTKPVHAPYPAACVQSGDRCNCYTQQATKISVSKQFCAQVVENGYFVAWEDASMQKAQPVPPPQQAQPWAQQGPAMGGFDAGSYAAVDARKGGLAPGGQQAQQPVPQSSGGADVAPRPRAALGGPIPAVPGRPS